MLLVAQAIRNTIRANRFARIIRNWNTYFYSPSRQTQADSRESLEFPIRANHATKPERSKLLTKLSHFY